MSRILPILFNTDMVRAILKELNPKTATRRCIKGFIPGDAIWGYTIFTPKGYISCRGTFADEYGEKFFKLPCQPGDVLYVRETWNKCGNGYRYKADWEKDDIADITKWRPSIHMPREAARIWLRVTDVRVGRLQDITEEQAQAEGCNSGMLTGPCTARGQFENLWNYTIKKYDLASYGWDANPWVWVIEFERREKPEPCILAGMEPAEDKYPCIGYAKSDIDDEPCEMCKGCKQCTDNDEFERCEKPEESCVKG